MNKYTYTACIFLFASLLFSGCLTSPDHAKTNLKDEIQKKIAKFEALRNAVSSGDIEQGLPSGDIKDLYGEPDDVFSSGSSTGNFQIWTYEEISAKNKPTGQPIRLYINNGKLVSWSY